MNAAVKRAGYRLAELLPECPPAFSGLWVTGLALSSRDVTPGALFLAVPGRRGHGLDHLAEAQQRGAVAVAWEAGADAVQPSTLPAFEAPGLTARLGEIADRFYGCPSAAVDVLAVTGTNGKTTVSWLLANALEHLRMPCGYRGTLGATQGGDRVSELRSAELTTPNVVEMHRWLADQRAAAKRFAAVEASSHALDQGRLDGVRVKLAVFTNLTPEHLDYHRTMQAYGTAKARLFRRHELTTAVIYGDDTFAGELFAQLPPDVEPLCVGRDASAVPPGARWLQIRSVDESAASLTVEYRFDGVEGRIVSPLIGGFNAVNLALAHGALIALGIDPMRAADALGAVPAPAGRMETFGGGADAPLAVVDFAHTPDALERALHAVRARVAPPAAPSAAPSATKRRVICVFGCGGERDRAKRPRMGEIAARLADRVILTNDNPRGEDPASILAQIRAGMPAGADVREIPERRVAIQTAIAEARPGDAVLVAGRGHESVQIVGELRLPLDDRAVVRSALESRS